MVVDHLTGVEVESLEVVLRKQNVQLIKADRLHRDIVSARDGSELVGRVLGKIPLPIKDVESERDREGFELVREELHESTREVRPVRVEPFCVCGFSQTL